MASQGKNDIAITAQGYIVGCSFCLNKTIYNQLYHPEHGRRPASGDWIIGDKIVCPFCQKEKGIVDDGNRPGNQASQSDGGGNT